MGKCKQSLLHCAIMEDHCNILDFLLKENANPNLQALSWNDMNNIVNF